MSSVKKLRALLVEAGEDVYHQLRRIGELQVDIEKLERASVGVVEGTDNPVNSAVLSSLTDARRKCDDAVLALNALRSTIASIDGSL